MKTPEYLLSIVCKKGSTLLFPKQFPIIKFINVCNFFLINETIVFKLPILNSKNTNIP